MKKTVSKSKFKPRALEYFRDVQNTGKELIITDRGKPVLKIVPVAPDLDDSLKKLRHSLLKYEDPTEPVGAEDWDALQ